MLEASNILKEANSNTIEMNQWFEPANMTRHEKKVTRGAEMLDFDSPSPHGSETYDSRHNEHVEYTIHKQPEGRAEELVTDQTITVRHHHTRIELEIRTTTQHAEKPDPAHVATNIISQSSTEARFYLDLSPYIASAMRSSAPRPHYTNSHTSRARRSPSIHSVSSDYDSAKDNPAHRPKQHYRHNIPIRTAPPSSSSRRAFRSSHPPPPTVPSSFALLREEHSNRPNSNSKFGQDYITISDTPDTLVPSSSGKKKRGGRKIREREERRAQAATRNTAVGEGGAGRERSSGSKGLFVADSESE